MDVCQDVGAWERIIKNSLDVICTIDRNGYIINTNEAGKRILGYECEELTGEPFKSFVHPDDLPAALHIVQDIINGYKTSSFESRCIHKSGAEVHLVWSGVWSAEDEVILCVGRDVTEQKLAQQKLREKDERYRALVEQGSDMLALIDEEINYLFCAGPILKELAISAFTAGLSSWLLSVVSSLFHSPPASLKRKSGMVTYSSEANTFANASCMRGISCG